MMNMTIKAATPAERLYIAEQGPQIAGQTGYIGHFRTDGQGGAHPWTVHNNSLYTDNFRKELKTVLQALKDHKLEADETLALRADTARYSFLSRSVLKKDGAELDLHCYLREHLDRHMKHAEKGIRFVSTDYKEKFRIEDGDMVRITFDPEETIEWLVRYIDDCHVEICNNSYHICEVAQQLERSGGSVIPLRSSLPKKCFSVLDATGEIIIITRGQTGYQPTGKWAQGMPSQVGVDVLNDGMNITKAQAAAMRAGSQLGWDTPAADPRNYNEQGEPIKPRYRDRGEAR